MTHSKKLKNGDFEKFGKYGKILLVVVLICLAWWKVIRFPRQIFGTAEDHFRVYVLDPMPASVRDLRVAFDDLIIHPDVIYWFRFNIDPEDLKKIIMFHSLQKVSEGQDVLSPPSWWDVGDLHNPEIYTYVSKSRKLLIGLWWNGSASEAYYIFVTL